MVLDNFEINITSKLIFEGSLCKSQNYFKKTGKTSILVHSEMPVFLAKSLTN